MYKSIKNLTLIILFIFFSLYLHSQSPLINFDHISIDDGLSQSTVLAIIQDSEGLMWFGTHDGLNRFDGYNFVIFKNNANDNKSISNNIIYSLFESKNKTLWIGTNGGGLCKYDKETERFTNYKLDTNNINSINCDVIRVIFEDKYGNLWIGTNSGGLNKFDSKNEIFTHYVYSSDNENSIPSNRVNSIIEDYEGKLWLGTEKGFSIFNPKTENFHNILLEKNIPESNSNIVYDILFDNEGVAWIATKNGLFKYSEISEEIIGYQHNENDKFSLSHNTVTKLFIDKENNFWIGTSGGLNIYDRINNRFFVFKHNSFMPKTLNHDNISTIFQDKSGIIWIGTWERGINIYDKLAQKFPLYENNPENKNSIPDKTVRSIFEDSDGSLWIGLVEGGLFHFDKNQEFSSLNIHNNYIANSLKSNTVTAILRDSYNELWVGTWDGGLSKAIFSNDTENDNKWQKVIGFKNYSRIENNSNSLSDNSIQCIFEDSKHRLWIGTSYGLMVYNRENDNFIRITEKVTFNNQSVQKAIQEDKNGNIWIGTWDGLHKISDFEDFNNIEIEYFLNVPTDTTSICDNRIISLLVDNDGTLWAGTFGSGFCKMYIENNKIKFKNYSELDGLSNNVIYSLYDDNYSNIWLSTNKGLSKFNTENQTFTNYDESDGLQSKEFFWGAGYKGISGTIYFGGIEGINAFQPSEITDNQYIPPIVITNFKIFNENVEVGDNSPLTKSILFTDLITLTHKDKIISFEFSALQYSKPQKNQYEFKLEGFNNEWIKVDATHRIASYTNLDPGKYTFLVRGSNSDGIWNLEGAKIEIIIKPPFWETWAFRILIIVLIIILILIIFKWRLRRISKQKELLEHEVDERTKEINQKNYLLNQQKDEIQAQAEELKATNDELAKLSIVAAETDNAVIITDENGNIEWLNDGFTRMYGYNFNEYTNLFGKNIKCISSNLLIENIFNNLVENRHTIHYENKSITKSGKEIWVQTTLTPIIDEFGNVSKIVGIDTDITDSKNAEFEIIEKNKKIEFQNTHIKQSIKYAKTIQQAILPSQKFINKYFENFILYKPKDIVSGDFYWFTKFSDTINDTWLFAVLDCTGHGVPGAFMSMIGNRLLNEIVNERKITTPNLILNQLNLSVIKALRQEETLNDDGMDVVICKIEKIEEEFKIIFAGAKRSLYYISASDKILKDLPADRRTVGGKISLKSKVEYTNKELTLEKNSMVYLTTDGYSDQNNPERKRIGSSKMKDVLLHHFEDNCEIQCQKLEEELAIYQKDAEQRDDITVIGLRLK